MGLKCKKVTKFIFKKIIKIFNNQTKIANKHINFQEKRNLFNKIIAISLMLIIFFYTLSFKNFSNANLEDNEKVNLDEIQKTIETSANLNKDSSSNEPKLDSRIALVYDRNSGNVLYEKNGHKTTPMASTTKIMTSIVVLEKTNLKDTVVVDKKAAATGGSRLGLKTGDKLTVNDLLYGLMLRSGNDAAVALAVYVGGSIEGFAKLMNQKAAELGLKNTNFVTPHGLDSEKHYTTAYELAKMADYALKNEKFRKIVGTKNCNITINGASKNISNTNELLEYLNGVYGIKTGFTNGAGRCLVTSCKRGELDIITVVLGADTKKIIGDKFNDWLKINENRVYVNKGITNEMKLSIENLSFEKMAVKKQNKDIINVEINAIFYFEAPVKEKSTVGNLKVIIDGKEIEILDIYNEKEVEKKQLDDYIKEFLYNVRYV